MAADGYEDFMDFGNMTWDSIEKWISAARNRNLNIKEFSLSAAKEKVIQALALWVNESLCIGRVNDKVEFDETDFTTINIPEIFEDAYTHYLDWNTDSDVIATEKFSYKKWKIWDEAVRNLLKSKIGVTKVPLSYGILKDTTPLTMYHLKFIIYNASFC